MDKKTKDESIDIVFHNPNNDAISAKFIFSTLLKQFIEKNSSSNFDTTFDTIYDDYYIKGIRVENENLEPLDFEKRRLNAGSGVL